MASSTTPYDAILIVSFGGPEGPDEVMPFLENVLRGKNVPRERMLQVAEHYQHFNGVSPLNEQNRQLIVALQAELNKHGPNLPIYWGNRNWQPLLPDTLRQMAADGVKRAIAYFTSAYSSYSGCRQYRENIQLAQREVGSDAPQVDKVRVFYNHPAFVQVIARCVQSAIEQLPSQNRAAARIVFTAHSIPQSMAQGCNYERQLLETGRLVCSQLGYANWKLVYQSRSGPPTQPWLEPDVCDYLRQIHAEQPAADVIIAPIGFLSDHLEVMYDLDTEAADLCRELGLNMIRAATVGNDPQFVRMVRDLIAERVEDRHDRPAVGQFPASHDICPVDCCLSGRPAPAKLP